MVVGKDLIKLEASSAMYRLYIVVLYQSPSVNKAKLHRITFYVIKAEQSPKFVEKEIANEEKK